jgi:hypothetical protein
LLGVGQNVIAEADTCSEHPLLLEFPAGTLHVGDSLILELTEDQRGVLRYDLEVIDPVDLPHPEMKISEDWQLGAWRLATSSPKLRLDAISRLQMAPSDSYGAQRILDYVWDDKPF